MAQGWGGVLYVPAPEDTDQVKVISYSFSAEYGFSTGNAISITTKAGTHDCHFVADEYMRNPDADANLYFNNLEGIPRHGDHRNQFGVAGGGPLYIPGIYKQRDKTFFFFNYEGLRLNGSGTVHLQVPTTAQLGGDFSAELGTQVGTDCAGHAHLCRAKSTIPTPHTNPEARAGHITFASVIPETKLDPRPEQMYPED